MITIDKTTVYRSHIKLLHFFKNNAIAADDPKVYKETPVCVSIDEAEDLDMISMDDFGNIKINPEKNKSGSYFDKNKCKDEEAYYTKILNSGIVIDEIVKHLEKDRYSRRAVYNFWKKSFFNNPKKEGTCISYIYLRCRSGKIYLHSHMRANDLINLYVLDLTFLFFLGKTISERLGVEFGGIVHFIDSLQVYKKSLKTYNSIYE